MVLIIEERKLILQHQEQQLLWGAMRRQRHNRHIGHSHSRVNIHTYKRTDKVICTDLLGWSQGRTQDFEKKIASPAKRLRSFIGPT